MSAPRFDGALDVALLNGYVPPLGTRFDVVTYGSRVGNFASFTGLTLPNGNVLVPGYDGGAFYLTTAVPEPVRTSSIPRLRDAWSAANITAAGPRGTSGPAAAGCSPDMRAPFAASASA